MAIVFGTREEVNDHLGFQRLGIFTLMQPEEENGPAKYRRVRDLVFNVNIDTLLNQVVGGPESAPAIRDTEPGLNLHRVISSVQGDGAKDIHVLIWETLIEVYQEALDSSARAEHFSKIYGIEWDAESYARYVGASSVLEFEDRAERSSENPAMLGLVAGLVETIKCLKELTSLLTPIDDLLAPYDHADAGSQFHSDNVRSLQKKISATVTAMVRSLARELNSPHVNKEWLLAEEFRTFNRFFDAELSENDRRFISRRLNISEAETDKVYGMRSEVYTTHYTKTYRSFDLEQRQRYAMVFACKIYLEYLDNQLSGKSIKGETATVEVPDPEPLDDRIRLHPKVLQYVENCFSLLKYDEDGGNIKEPVMSSDDVNYLLQSNFVVREPLTKKPFKANIRKGYLAYFFGQVLRRLITTSGIPLEDLKVKRIVQFVRENFPDFSSDKYESVEKALRRKLPKNFPGEIQGALNGHFETLKAELGIRQRSSD